MKKQKLHKATRWDDFDQNEFAEQILEEKQDHVRISQDVKRILAKTTSDEVKKMRKEWEANATNRRIERRNKLH